MKKRFMIPAALIFTMVFAAGCGSNGSDAEKLYDYDLSEYVELGQYKGVEVPEISEEEVNKEIDNRLLVPEELTEGTVESGDTANIDYVGTKDGVPFDGGTADGYDLTIGSGEFVPGFEDGLIGKKIGDTVEVNLTFPENYTEALAGQDVVFTVKINSVERPQKVALNEEFVKANSEYTTVEEYKASVKKELEDARSVDELIWNKVADESKVLKYPEKELKQMTDEVTQYYKDIAVSEDKTWEDLLAQEIGMTQEEFDERVLTDVQQQMKLELVVCAISRQEGLEISQKEYDDGKKEYLASMGYDSEKAYKDAFGTSFEENIGGKNNFELYLLYKKTIDFMVENAVSPK